MKKLLLTLGASVAVIAPVMTLIACGETHTFKLGESTYNSGTKSLDFKIKANESKLKALKVGEVQALQVSIVEDLVKYIKELESGADELNSTKISFDKTITYTVEGKICLGGKKVLTLGGSVLSPLENDFTIADVKTYLENDSAGTSKETFKLFIIAGLFSVKTS